ncbi:hypothetical protein EUZ85_01420 [Hahella sp. KA22]|uniref:hypothetical protein n=1 Tax=Hahella sp. KA22 TaxID=1628392 RepID=UPI000FDF0F92|nr:hypothetical protein [Hahella sp. KA22]AZZ95154.1 hypothetical protein ENC22_29710 [Hahella sp. KA22]QAY52799.1 hypothetical protein EUZ85_01420 [Hahella sp. KA22]
MSDYGKQVRRITQIGALGCSIVCAEIAAASDDGWRLYTEVESFSYSNAAPIYQIAHDLKGDPVARGDVAYTHDHIEIGAEYRNLSLSIVERYDYHLEFSPDAAELIYLYNNDLPHESDAHYDLYLAANQMRAKGVKLGYRFALTEAFNVKLAFSYLRADELTEGYLRGYLDTPDASPTGELELDYAYTEDHLLDRPPENVSGDGFAVDLYLHWRPHPQWEARLALEDAVNRIYWDRATATVARATSDTIDYDEDGALDVSPALSGNEGYRDHVQALPLRGFLWSEYHLNDAVSLGAGWRRYDKTDLGLVGADYRFNDRLTLGGRYYCNADALNLNLQIYDLYLGVTMDRLQWKQAKTLGLSLWWSYRFGGAR